jgi:protease I
MPDKPNNPDQNPVAILVAKLFEDIELLYPYYRLTEAGLTVQRVGPDTATYHGKHGVPVTPDVSIDEVADAPFSAVVIPGGYSPDHMRRVPAMVELVKRVHADGGVVAAICHGPWMLASAGLLKGRRATAFPSIRDDMVNAGAQWKDCEVVAEERIITSRKPDDLPAFCRTLLATLT